MVTSRYANLERSLNATSGDIMVAASNGAGGRSGETVKTAIQPGHLWYRELAQALFDVAPSFISGERVDEAKSVESCRYLCTNLAEEISAAACAKIRELSEQYDTKYKPTELWAYYFDDVEEDRRRRIPCIDVGDDDNPILPEFVLAMLFEQIDTDAPLRGLGVTITNTKSGAVSRVTVYLDLCAELGMPYTAQVQSVDVYSVGGPSVRHVNEEAVSPLEMTQYASQLTLLTADTSVALRTLSASFHEGEYDKVDFPENGRHPLEVKAEVYKILEKAKQQAKPVIVTTMSSVVCDCVCKNTIGTDIEVTNLHADADGAIYVSVAGITGEFAYRGVSDIDQAVAVLRNERMHAFNGLPDNVVAQHNALPLIYRKLTIINNVN